MMSGWKRHDLSQKLDKRCAELWDYLKDADTENAKLKERLASETEAANKYCGASAELEHDNELLKAQVEALKGDRGVFDKWAIQEATKRLTAQVERLRGLICESADKLDHAIGHLATATQTQVVEEMIEDLRTVLAETGKDES